MTEPVEGLGTARLKHRFTVTPVSERRAQALQTFAQTGDYPDEPVPDRILDKLKIQNLSADVVEVAGPEETMRFPTPLIRPLYFQMSRGYADTLLKRYTLPDFVDVEAGDTVVDCGAFAGGFSLAAAKTAGRVLAFEPSPRNFSCLSHNTTGKGVECIQMGLSDQSQTATFFERDNPTDSSVIVEDDKDTRGTENVQLINIPQVIRRFKLDHIDFMKVEAEGLELEILSKVTPERVRKLAIAATPERNFQSPFLDIAVLLANRGYELANDNYFLFARTP